MEIDPANPLTFLSQILTSLNTKIVKIKLLYILAESLYKLHKESSIMDKVMYYFLIYVHLRHSLSHHS